ncbi:inhibitor of nuclear factor kappa-B kinase-interacting protein isoform X1 [Denticeps clupeoides]|uniref:inhibitor of nuclear factor kappa-B kinase-interacting protein isoform X1 n=1 Tax=Denticeps clupeoides TaxID=299321 RepID=UPI0010A49B0D|nr:inhibitor of nuclear factor kappa-B kinase-interacting protein isoform X1 [Denticeps clupeoides]
MTNSAAKPRKNRASEETSSGAEAERQERRAGRAGLSSAACLLCASVCAVLACVVVRQNARLAEVEEKFALLLPGRTAGCSELERRLGTLSEKLDASRIRLEEAQSARAVTRVKQDVASLQSAVAAVEKEEFAASLGIQQVSGRFQNVTETWEGSLAVVMADLVELKAESRTSHGRMMESVNEADQQLLALAERMEELEDSTRRNARAFERTEEDDAQRVQGQLDWNTQQVAKLQDRLAQLAQQDAELLLKLEEHVPRARKCEEQLPVVEEAVRSILRLSAGLSSTERRVEEVSLQVLGLEDSMLKGLSQALELRQELDALQMHDSGHSVGEEIDVIIGQLQELRSEKIKFNEQRDILITEEPSLEPELQDDLSKAEQPVPQF